MNTRHYANNNEPAIEIAQDGAGLIADFQASGGQRVGFVSQTAIAHERGVFKRLEISQGLDSFDNPYFFFVDGQLRFNDTANGISYAVTLSDPQSS